MPSDAGTDLIVLVLRRELAPAVSATSAEWDKGVAVAVAQGLSSIVYRRFRDEGRTPSAGAAQRLHSHYLSGAASNMRLLHELGAILRALVSVGVPVIPLKGAFLAEAVYGDIALRPMADLDLLVQPVDLPRAIETLRHLGYESDAPFDPVAHQAGFQDMPPMRKPGGAMVELHWTLVTPLCGARIDEHELAGIWKRSVAATIADSACRALSAEDLLLHLCMHASVHHRFADIGLKSFVDMAEVTRHYGASLDWGIAADRANRWNVAGGVRLALMLAEEWTGLQVPADVWLRLDGAPPEEQTLAWVRHKVLEGKPTEFLGEFAGLESHRGAVGKLAILRRAVFPSQATMARLYGVRENSLRFVGYYPYRLWDLCRRYRGALWRLLMREPEFVEATKREAKLREYLGWR